jgi:hypothetical protein
MITLAAVLRLTATYWDYSLALLLAMMLWTVSFVSLAIFLLWLRKQEKIKPT